MIKVQYSFETTDDFVAYLRQLADKEQLEATNNKKLTQKEVARKLGVAYGLNDAAHLVLKSNIGVVPFADT